MRMDLLDSLFVPLDWLATSPARPRGIRLHFGVFEDVSGPQPLTPI